MWLKTNAKTFSIVLITFFIASLLTSPSANAAYTVAPKVGQCFQYTKAQVSAKYPPKNPVNCSSSHNMETYAVEIWPVGTNPVDMDRELVLDIVAELCNFWGTFPQAGNNRLRTSNFNYWAWYTPSRSAWAKGQRWLRCDAMIGKFSSAEEWPPATYLSWKGLKLFKQA
jgi:hypothetical protein